MFCFGLLDMEENLDDNEFIHSSKIAMEVGL